jgi:hypothetical protein
MDETPCSALTEQVISAILEVSNTSVLAFWKKSTTEPS